MTASYLTDATYTRLPEFSFNSLRVQRTLTPIVVNIFSRSEAGRFWAVARKRLMLNSRD